VSAAYLEFLATKVPADAPTGLEVIPSLPSALRGDQRVTVEWALRRGRAALFKDTGLGKTLEQLAWAAAVVEATSGMVLVLTPLAVAAQTLREGAKFGIPVTHARTPDDLRPGVNVTNYERMHLFDPAAFVGVVLDESSILKSYMGKTKRALIEAFQHMRFRLACTATPAPNDHMELGNHAEFLGAMDSTEMLSRWFINDTMHAGTYRLKAHAEADFWRWVASWAVCVARPSDLLDAAGHPFADDGFDLPPLNLETHVVGVDHSLAPEGELLRVGTLSATTLHKEMRLTAPDRAARVAEMVNGSEECWVVWCNTNYEADELARRIPGALEVRGSDTMENKEKNLARFSEGGARVLITKPSIAGFGLNWQHCARHAFVGLSYSYEQLYQALRRSWRFGQKRAVEAHLILAETEVGVLAAIQDKQAAHEEMKGKMVGAMREVGLNAERRELRMEIGAGHVGTAEGEGWRVHQGDCVEVIRDEVASESVGLSVFSPPFSNLYIYTDDLRDMGNTEDLLQFMEHFGYLIPELFRVTISGRLAVVHCKDLPLYQGRDGVRGLNDFPAALSRAFTTAHLHRDGSAREEFGGGRWALHSRVSIWKSPVTEMERTKNHGLLYKELCKDSAGSRQGMADYLLVFRKWNATGDFSDPVTRGKERFKHYVGLEPPDPTEICRDLELPLPRRSESGKWPAVNPFPRGSEGYRWWSILVWQKYASPVWFDINQTDVLNYQLGRDNKDEKHICPLQLDVIERAVELWSNPNDLVLSPFTGIGSEGYVARKCDRRFVGAELKESYWRIAARNLQAARASQEDLFGGGLAA
jgi:DNA modification methylase